MFDVVYFLNLALRTVAAGLCNIIYWLISKMFQLFMIVSQLNILSSDDIGPIYERITLILTIVMVFYVTFEFVKYVVKPDDMTDKEKGVGNITARIIIAVVLIAFVPRLFTMAYDLQNRLITNQVFSKIILGEKNIQFATFGSSFSADVLGRFYTLDEEYCGESNYDAVCQTAETHINNNLEQLRVGQEVTLMPGLNETKDFTIGGTTEKVFPVKFDGLLAVAVGGVILYLVILYTIDIGTRYAQLIFLQIISPIAIIGYIPPKKDNMFTKWLKQCTTTYLDLFIRLTIIYFVLLIIDVLSDSFNSGSLFAGIAGTAGYETLVYVVLIIGLLIFAQKAPKMLGELFPSSGAAGIGYGLRSPKKFLSETPLLGRAIGAAYASSGSMLKNTRKATGEMINALKKGEYKDAFKWLFRGTAGNVGVGIGGLFQGAKSKDLSGWQRAMKNNYDRAQARNKIRDVGYSAFGDHAGKWWSDKARNILLMDQSIEDIATGKELYVQTLQQKIAELQKNGNVNTEYTVQISKATGKLLVFDKEGNMTEYNDEEALRDAFSYEDENTKEKVFYLEDNLELAKLNKQLGKAQSQNKALHQKENEAKEKK